MTPNALGGLAGVALILVAAFVLATAQQRAHVRRRLFEPEDEASPDEGESETGVGAPRSRLALWLARAGYRSPRAPTWLVASIGTCTVGGVLTTWVLLTSAWLPAGAASLLGLPVVGGGAAALLGLAPWAVGGAVAAAPILWVRARRRDRANAVERDLPLCLESLATLAEAGSGFDASIAHWLDAHPGDRPLAQELRLYQLEMRTGAGRVRCLERLAERIGTSRIDDVVTALVHAEGTGAGLAGILRPQADDVRQHRRERALARAEALPEKLVLPLLLGFLPGLMIWTLGPAF
ncbi:MAG: type II secretion system F family protein, partial [Myxococcota bacterium]